jgi:hypothetical protein
MTTQRKNVKPSRFVQMWQAEESSRARSVYRATAQKTSYAPTNSKAVLYRTQSPFVSRRQFLKLDTPEKQKDDDDDQYGADATDRTITPVLAMRPPRPRSKQREHQYNDQDYSEHLSLPFPRLPTRWHTTELP